MAGLATSIPVRTTAHHSATGWWDKNKLPNGIEGLLSDAKKHGVKFGIWIEPEMANTTSELYEKHPDWVLKASEP